MPSIAKLQQNYVAALKAEHDRRGIEIERLRAALKMCPPDRPQMTDPEFREAVNIWWRLHARPALADTKEP